MTWAVDHSSPTPSVVFFRNPLFTWELLIYRPRKDERLSWPRWLTMHSGQFTRKVAEDFKSNQTYLFKREYKRKKTKRKRYGSQISAALV